MFDPEMGVGGWGNGQWVWPLKGCQPNVAHFFPLPNWGFLDSIFKGHSKAEALEDSNAFQTAETVFALIAYRAVG